MLPDGEYQIVIDVENVQDVAEIGELILPGDSDEEILVSSYLCHPRGANDNLSGITVAVELFRMLALAQRRRFTYRLAIWPETIGALCFLDGRAGPWPAPGSEDTELGVLIEPEVGHGETEIYPRVQA
jgi:aminopeptidase-like protein